MVEKIGGEGITYLPSLTSSSYAAEVSREEQTTTEEAKLASTVLVNIGKTNWQENTEQALKIGYARFFVGLDPKKSVFTSWENQLLPLAREFVGQYTLVNQLI